MKRSTKRTLGCLAAAALGFTGLLALLHSAAGVRPHIEGYSGKLAHFEARADEFSVIFVGSSRVFRHMVPEVFDEAAAEAGLRVRSFNLGIDGLSLIEMRTLLEQIARTPGPSPRHVLLEPALGAGLHSENLGTTRAAYFRDLENTMEEIEALRSAGRGAGAIRRSVLACLHHYAFVGRLAAALLPPSTGPPGLASRLAASRGFEAQDRSENFTGERYWRRVMLERFEDFLSRALQPKPPQESTIRKHRGRHRLILQSALELEDAGATPIFVTTPSLRRSETLLAFEAFHRRRRPPVPLLSHLADLRGLDDRSKWFDPGHMTGEGAAIFSRRLARDFVRLVTSREGR